MSILGVVIRCRPTHLDAVLAQLQGRPGLDVTHNPGDGRLVLVIEDCAEQAATATLAAVALLPEVQSTSLVYEYSGPDAPASGPAVTDYNAWRSSLQDMATGNDAGTAAAQIP
jgi:nitrate reductase NapAB chaperone NapD